MTSDGGHWPRSGRHRPEAGAYDHEDGYDDQHGPNGHDEPYQDPGSYGRPAWYDPHDGYGSSGGYGGASGDASPGPGGYADPYGHADPRGYGDQNGYGGNGGYADSGYGADAGYAGPEGYGGQDGYGAGGYGDQGGNTRPGRHGTDGGYADAGNYGEQGGYGGSGYSQAGYPESGYRDQAGYRAGDSYGGDADGGYGTGLSSRGRHSTGGGADRAGQGAQDPHDAGGYGHDASAGRYGTDSYRTESGYGSGDPYGTGSFTSYEHEDLGRDQGPTSSYQWQDQYGQTDPLTGSFRADDTGSYDTGSYDTGHSSWAFTPGSQDREDYDPGGQALAAEPFPGDPASGFGTDSGVFSRPDTGAFDRPDTGSFGLDDSSSFGRPDTGSFGYDDSSTFGRPDTGSFRRADSGSFGQIDTGSFDRDEEFRGGSDQDADSDSGSIRWTSGPPPLRTRADRDGDEAVSGRGAPLGDPADRADWRDDPADGDWQDESDDGLLSRRFGRSGEPPEPEAGAGRVKVRGRKKRRVRGKAAVTASILAVVLVLAVAGVFGYRFVHSWVSNRYGDYTGSGTGTVRIIVNTGDTLAGLGSQLVQQDVIMTERPYETAAAAASGTLQPGVYKLHRHMNSALAVKFLLSAKYRIRIQAVIIEGMRATAIAAELAKRTNISAMTFMNIINNPPASLGLPAWAPKGVSAEGFLFPDTYNFLPHQSALSILQMMVSDFNKKTASIRLVSGAKKVFTTPWHALIVGSLVQAEAGTLADMPKISRVVWNRLKINKPLEFDSTVFYAMHKYGTSITAQEEKFKSPYNTYQHTGLPPGPIGNPGLDAIQAALHPVKAHYLYFITDTRHKPFMTHFTASLKQLQEWQRQFQG